MKKHDVVILHGTGGSPEGNWFPWLKKQLESAGYNVYIPRLPTPEGQSVENWNKALNEQVPPISKNTILIGHSCGATFLLHILEALKEPITQSIFVSGFIDKLGNDFFDNLNETFVSNEFNWGTIKKNAGKITLFHGDYDPYIPMSAAKKLAEKLDTPLTIIPNGGHLNAEFGYTEFPQILEMLMTID
ncbi:MAG: alpha/beta hydrolase [Alphaproteobacteria bacterium]|nr:alpha/beta hydrolase [Alphaproteobacteria bacterium]